ncbi:hypothetical protein SFC42_23635 [Priestia filamentosa]|uniref:hypothetical protein n=1 Tax=Priestia filamentosa TaxID=1402861 RepID=UPI003983CD80
MSIVTLTADAVLKTRFITSAHKALLRIIIWNLGVDLKQSWYGCVKDASSKIKL